MRASPAVAAVVAAALTSGACMNAFDAVRPVRDPGQSAGLVTVGIVGDGALAVGANLAEGQVSGGNHFYLWWLGLFFTDVLVFVSRKMAHARS